MYAHLEGTQPFAMRIICVQTNTRTCTLRLPIAPYLHVYARVLFIYFFIVKYVLNSYSGFLYCLNCCTNCTAHDYRITIFTQATQNIMGTIYYKYGMRNFIHQIFVLRGTLIFMPRKHVHVYMFTEPHAYVLRVLTSLCG